MRSRSVAYQTSCSSRLTRQSGPRKSGSHHPAEDTHAGIKSSLADMVLYFIRFTVFRSAASHFRQSSQRQAKSSSAPFGAHAPHRPHLGTTKNSIFPPNRLGSILPRTPVFTARIRVSPGSRERGRQSASCLNLYILPTLQFPPRESAKPPPWCWWHHRGVRGTTATTW